MRMKFTSLPILPILLLFIHIPPLCLPCSLKIALRWAFNTNVRFLGIFSTGLRSQRGIWEHTVMVPPLPVGHFYSRFSWRGRWRGPDQSKPGVSIFLSFPPPSLPFPSPPPSLPFQLTLVVSCSSPPRIPPPWIFIAIISDIIQKEACVTPAPHPGWQSNRQDPAGQGDVWLQEVEIRRQDHIW